MNGKIRIGYEPLFGGDTKHVEVLAQDFYAFAMKHLDSSFRNIAEMYLLRACDLDVYVTKIEEVA